jgi:DNA-directed RNA polymerase subunit RPC12/RpoP
MKPPKFPCPSCGGRTLVIDSRYNHRKRKCLDCGAEVRTREIVIDPNKPSISSSHPVPKHTA